MYDMTKTNGALEPMHDRAERDRYPDGLKITLDADTLRKLAISHRDLQVGDVLDIVGQAQVVGIEIEPVEIAGEQACVELQFVTLSIGDEDSTLEDDPAEQAEPRSLADRMFG